MMYSYPPQEELWELLQHYAAATQTTRSAIAKNERGENLRQPELLLIQLFNQRSFFQQKLAA